MTNAPNGLILVDDAYFHAGKRDCLGRTLAVNEVFLFLTALLQHFEVSATDPDNPPTLEPVVRVTHAPQQFSAKLRYRQKA